MHEHPPTDRAAAYEQLLAAFLAERDVPCTSCGHNLRGVTSGACPECGGAITISLAHVDRATVPWFLALIGYAIAAGMSGLGSLVLALRYIFDDLADAEEQAVAIAAIVTFILSLTVLICIICGRHRIWAWRRLRQWLLVASVLLVPVLVIAGIATAEAITS